MELSTAYFETSWAVLSTIGLNNVFVGLIVAGIAGGFSVVALVPIIVSAACAVANGLCYHNLYTDHPPLNKAVASAFADLAWMIQEAGLPFYSYAILTNVLRGAERMVFLTLFWALMLVIAVVRVAIIVLNVRFFLDDDHSPDALALHSKRSNRWHVGYFVPIAMVECVSAVFLLKTFRSALRSSMPSGVRSARLPRYLLHSTEIRLATLALIGFTRVVTFSFHTTGVYKGVTTQIDLFVYILGCLFPIIMFVDILASRVVFAQENNHRISNIGGVETGSHEGIVRTIEVSGNSGSWKSSGDGASTELAGGVNGADIVYRRSGAGNSSAGINETIEFEVHEGWLRPSGR